MKKLIVLLVLALGLVGCQKPADTPNPAESSTQAESQTESQMESQAESQTDDDMIGLADAVKVFTDKYPGASIAEISFEREAKSAQYEIEGFDETHEFDLSISAKDGSMIKEEAEKDRISENKAIDLSLLSKVDELIENALQDASQDYSLDSYSVDFEESGSYNQLDIEVKTKDGKDIEYEYNLETGELVKKDS